jgi:RNA polymerase sigma-70 factor (ECF subfamily)
MIREDVEPLRGRLLGIAYRLLGSMSDAEDTVQEAYLRWHRNEPDVRSAEAWLVTVITRLGIDRLRVRAREVYDGPWLPEPVAADWASDPQRRMETSADLATGFMLLLERLSPDERAALVLREAFGYSYDEIAAVVDKRQDACRQLVHRAKAAVRTGREKHATVPADKERIIGRFLSAMERGDEADVLRLIAPDARWIADGGGKAAGAATRILTGADRVSKMAVGLCRKFNGVVTGESTLLLGEPAILWKAGGQLVTVVTIDTDGSTIDGFYNVLNPEKLTRAW